MGIGSGIKATTGFQAQGYEKAELETLFKNTLASGEKFFEFTQRRLRGARDVFKDGGHVTSILKDQKFRLFYDNRRIIIAPKDFTGFDMSNVLFDSRPLATKNQCASLRFFAKLTYTLPFNKFLSRRKGSFYKSFLEVGVRNFLKGYLSKEPCFGLRGNEFKRVKDLIAFIYGFTPAKELRLSFSSISNLKYRKIIFRPVPNTKENIAFSKYIKSKISYFEESLFLKKNNNN